MSYLSQNGALRLRCRRRLSVLDAASHCHCSDLQALLYEDDTQTEEQEQLAEQFGVDRTVISRRLQEIGKIRRIGAYFELEHASSITVVLS